MLNNISGTSFRFELGESDQKHQCQQTGVTEIVQKKCRPEQMRFYILQTTDHVRSKLWNKECITQKEKLELVFWDFLFQIRSPFAYFSWIQTIEKCVLDGFILWLIGSLVVFGVPWAHVGHGCATAGWLAGWLGFYRVPLQQSLSHRYPSLLTAAYVILLLVIHF